MKGKLSRSQQKPTIWASLSFSSNRFRVRHKRGAIAIMTAILLFVIFGFFMLALDLSRLYNRKSEMQTLADTIALAAANKLNGTREGVIAALAAAREAVELPGNNPKYAYVNTMVWENAAIKFGASRDGNAEWKTDVEATNSPASLLFVKVDTSQLSGHYGFVDMFFAPVLSPSLSSVEIGQVTVAGRSRFKITPLGICAMSTAAQEKRQHTADTQYDELVEYGFRRGVGYDLMKLNPKGSSPMSFQVDPISLAGGGSIESNFNSSIFGTYICTGTMTVPKVTGASVSVRSLFPISTYYTHLNSRFDPYTGTCDVNASPPDSNVKTYPYASINWMSLKASAQVAKQDASNTTKLQTIAEIGPPNYASAVDYGALWTFARPVPWSSVQTQGFPEPTGGYTPFNATTLVWSKLYGSASAVSTYPNSTPYLMTSGSTYFQTPPTAARRPGSLYRRVLNIPLLACPVTGTSATVLAIGRFLMTVPADSTSVYAEFGGTTTDSQLGGPVEIYQ